MLTHTEDLYLEWERRDSKSKKTRLVEEPKRILKCVQKRIEELLKRIKLPNYVHAPAKGRSYISNAKAHVNAVVVRSLDIEKYFPSTPARHVYCFFHKRMKCSPDVAGILTKLSTFKDHLPTGSPSSAILSYFSHIDMWEAINEIVERANCTLTVYMDDVTISGDCVPDNLIWQVKQQFHRYGLHSNRNKEKHYIGKKSYEVTGVVITDGELKSPNRQHYKMHEVRKKIHLETEPEKRIKLMRSLRGLKAQMQQVREANNLAVET
ncbi:MAG: reverse transcriptase family protein [Nostocaceae cyanobacterium]|nr:reverse transcriptase family protein [Nostocaceae cyanobacterium]